MMTTDFSRDYQAYLDRQMERLAPEQKRAYLNFLRRSLTAELRARIISLYALYGAEWPFKERFEQEEGQLVIEVLRAAGYPDSELPEGSWDSYIQRLLEIVCGLRRDPLSEQEGANAA